MNRLTITPENETPLQIATILRDIEQLKNRQGFGADSIRPRIVQTEDLFDIDSTFDDVSPGQWATPFTGSNAYFRADTQLNPYATPVVKILNPDGS